MKIVVVQLKISGGNLSLFFKISVLFFLISSVFATNTERKSLLKSLLNKKYHYQSSIVRSEYLLGEEIVLSNRVSKGKYSVAGKPIFFSIIEYSPAERSLFSFMSKAPVNELHGVVGASNLKDKEEFTNLVESLSIKLLSNNLITGLIAKSNINSSTLIDSGLTDPRLTDLYGQVNFSFVPSVTGSYTLAVYFLHSKNLYTEHVNFLKFRVVNPPEVSLNFIYSLFIPFGLLFLSVVGMIIYRWLEKRNISQVVKDISGNKLFGYTSIILEQFYFFSLREILLVGESRGGGGTMAKNILVMTLVHIIFFMFIIGLLFYSSYWYVLALFFLVVVRSRLTCFYGLLSILLLLINFSIDFYAKNSFITLSLAEYYYGIIFFMVIMSLLFPFPPFFFAVMILAWIEVPKSEIFELSWLFSIITSGSFFVMIYLNWYLGKKVH